MNYPIPSEMRLRANLSFWHAPGEGAYRKYLERWSEEAHSASSRKPPGGSLSPFLGRSPNATQSSGQSRRRCETRCFGTSSWVGAAFDEN
jgi:hypothetical protein